MKPGWKLNKKKIHFVSFYQINLMQVILFAFSKNTNVIFITYIKVQFTFDQDNDQVFIPGFNIDEA